MANPVNTTLTQPLARAHLLPGAFAALLLGCLFVYGVGFASPATIHNAAHDTRHSFAFPCH